MKRKLKKQKKKKIDGSEEEGMEQKLKYLSFVVLLTLFSQVEQHLVLFVGSFLFLLF